MKFPRERCTEIPRERCTEFPWERCTDLSWQMTTLGLPGTRLVHLQFFISSKEAYEHHCFTFDLFHCFYKLKTMIYAKQINCDVNCTTVDYVSFARASYQKHSF